MTATLLVATGSEWKCSASESVLHFEPHSEGGSADNPRVARLEVRLPILEANGFAERNGRSLSIPYSSIAELDDEDRALIETIASPAPLSLQLKERGHLGGPDFRIEVNFSLGSKQVPAKRVGPFIDLHGHVYQLPWGAFHLIEEVEALNSHVEQGADQDHLFRLWGRTRASAKEAGADLSQYLEEEEVLVADRVAPTLVQSASGHTSLVPEIAGVPSGEFEREYLRHDGVPRHYSITDAQGHKIRIFVEPEIRSVLESWRVFRRLSPRERDRLLADPKKLIPEDVSTDVVDLSSYGPRVRAIGEYPAYVRAYVSSGQRWDDLGGGDPATSEEGVERIGLELDYLDGEREQCEFEGRAEAQKLLAEVKEALSKGDPVIPFRGKKLRVDPDLVAALAELVQRTRRAAEQDTAVEQEPVYRPRGVGLLIYANEDELEFSIPLEEREPLDTAQFVPPSALLPGVALKLHQRRGFAWLAHRYLAGSPGVLLADDMGLGKTLQALSFLAWLIETGKPERLASPTPPWDPILVVAPPTLLGVWREEIERFFDESVFMPIETLTTEGARRMRVAAGRESEVGRPVLDASKLRESRLVLTSYQTLSAYGLSLGMIDWSVVVSDEAQALKDQNTRTSIVFKALKAGFRLALTGTPVETRLLDVWNLFDSLHPGLLGSAKEFSARYEPRRADGTPQPAPDAARELARRIGVAGSGAIPKATRLLRRTKNDELADLPKKKIHRVPSDLGVAQREAYLSLIQRFREISRQGKALEMLAQLSRLCQHPRLLGSEIQQVTSDDLLRESPKLQSLLSTLDEISKSNEKALIFAHFRDAQFILKRAIDHRYGIEASVLNGDRAGGTERVQAARLDLIRKFEGVSGFNAMIVSPRVGGVGLTITGANHVVHYGRWWNPAREDQCTDRVYRIGQKRDVHVYLLISRDPQGRFRTFDERLDDLLEQRRTTAESFLLPQGDEGQLARDLVSSLEGDGEADSTPAAERPLRSLEDVAALSPEGFEALAAALFEAEGYRTFLTPLVGDGGIDVVALKAEEIVLVQCKHTSTGHALKAEVMQELDDGEVFYRARILPGNLTKGARIRCILFTNAPKSRNLAGAARSADSELLAEKDLRQWLGRFAIPPSAIGRWLGNREANLMTLRATLAAAGTIN